jgi:hypothetical protein
MNITLNLTDEEVELLLTALNEASYQSASLGIKDRRRSDNLDALYDKVDRMLYTQLNQRNR